MKHLIPTVLLAAGLAAGLASCGSARRSEPLAGPLPIASARVAEGQVVFMRHCEQCHTQGEASFGPALNNVPAPAPAIRLQVRNGLGAMPAFSPQEISEPELDALVAYLTAMRHHP